MKNIRTKKLMIFAALLSVLAVGCQTKSVNVTGAGATFPQPFYSIVFKKFYEATRHKVTYGGIGSGGGINSLKEGVVDFAGSDAYLSDEEMTEIGNVLHIPTCMGAVVVAYNLPGIQELNLTGELVAKIFAGEITYWDDAQIEAINEGVSLPHKKISPVYRSDGSGTTFVFTDYLSKVSEDWKNQFGSGKAVSFPTGIAAKGNPGIAGVLSQTEGTIGYIGSEYAFAQQLTYANLQNQSGKFVKPSAASISAAAQGEIPEDMRCMITNSEAPDAYPISLFTWLIVKKELNNGKRTQMEAEGIKDMLRFMISDEMQKIAEQIHYAPLPKKVQEQTLKNIDSIHFSVSEITK